MAHSVGTRQEQKQRTRQALLDAALRLMESQSLGSLSLREVTREVGIVPAAFYRHFRDMDDLGIALATEALGALRPAIRAARQGVGESEEIIRRSVDVLVAYVHANHRHFRFIAREKFGGVEPVRRAIFAELRLATDELAADLAGQDEFAGWSREDLGMFCELLVNQMLLLAAALLDVTPEDEPKLLETAQRQLRLIVCGRRHWLDAP
jgi:AcrR family transcriptional regulator